MRSVSAFNKRARREMMVGIVCLLCILFGPTVLATSGASPVPVPEGLVAGSLHVYEDPSGNVTLDQMLQRLDRFKEVQTNAPYYDFTTSTYWLRLPVTNQLGEPITRYLNIQHPLLDYITLYVIGSGNRRETIHSGDRLAARDRPSPATTLVLPFHLEAGESADLLLRVRADASTMVIPIEICDENSLQAAISWSRLIHGAFLGLFLGLFVYNLFLFLLLRERTYLYYVIYLPITYLSMSSLDGFASAVISPESTWLGNEGLAVFSGLSFVGDPIRFRQIVLNLIGNAIKFTERGEIGLHVRMESKNGDSALLRCTVSDTGIGIPAERLGRIFGAFEQVDASTTRKYGGTGLGLAISTQLILLTCATQPGAAELSRELKIAARLMKPAIPSDLLRTIASIFDKTVAPDQRNLARISVSAIKT